VQAREVADALEHENRSRNGLGNGFEAEIVPIKTSGDRSGVAGGDKSRFVKEIEDALLRGDVDLAVHSAKDVPGELPEGLEIAAVPAAEDPRDALVGAGSLEGLAPGACVGTSSLRRRSQLLAVRPDLEVTELRGNVDTRLGKLAAGDYDAIVLALAGLRRLGREQDAGELLEPRRFVPAPGQGMLALEIRAGDDHAAAAVAPVDHEPSRLRLECERAIVTRLDATCRTPVGGSSEIANGSLRAFAYAGLPDGSEWIVDGVEGKAAEAAAVGRLLAERMLAAGALELLRRAANPRPISPPLP
jgi:hydroxymethylbilane synthase